MLTPRARALASLVAVIGFVAGLAACVPPVEPPAPPAPPEFAATYTALNASLDAWKADLAPRQPTGSTPVFGAHLLAANANRGPALLAPATLPVVDLELDRFQAIGVRGITVSISFPLLIADQPRAAEYVQFYKTVAEHVRARGMTLSVEQHVVFAGTAFSQLPPFDFAHTSFEQFVALDREMTRTILANVRPDYLTILSEPDTFELLTGYPEASTPAGAADMVERIVKGLSRRKTKIGAGSGSWLPDAVQYTQAFAARGLDYIALHVYPATNATLTRAQAVVDAARAAGKPVVLDEAWLYKIGPAESLPSDQLGFTEAFRRDAYSFWAPLDAKFLGLVAEFARDNGIAYVAPFWTGYFFAYVDYSPATADLAYNQLAPIANAAAFAAIQAGTYSSTGRVWRDAIR